MIQHPSEERPAPKKPIWRKRSFVVSAIIALVIMGLLAAIRHWTRGPGVSYRGPLPALTAREKALAVQLHLDVQKLAGEIGVRNYQRYENLGLAKEYIARRFRALGYAPEPEVFEARGLEFVNLIASVPGASPDAEVVIVGAHYDSAIDCPAANDNGSGVAALLALAEHFVGKRPRREIRFVAFTNEEPPFSFGPQMGSHVTARRCHARGERIAAAISLETLAYYSDEPNSQAYPPPVGLFYPSTGNFVGFVSNIKSRPLLDQALGTFRQHVSFPSEGAALPALTPGVGWSDHWSFWQFGYPAIMVTDTAPFRYPHYHRATDTPDKLDYKRLARVVVGLESVVADLAQ